MAIAKVLHFPAQRVVSMAALQPLSKAKCFGDFQQSSDVFSAFFASVSHRVQTAR
jgi:hypothetical protein